MEKEFSSISELGNAIMEAIKRIEDGNLSITELEIATREAAELYERLVVLRFKAYDELVKSGAEEDLDRMSTPIRITVPDNQINLIDAIEEEESKDDPEESAAVPAPDPEPEVAHVEPEPEPEPDPELDPDPKPDPVVAENLFSQEEEEESLAEKLSKKPIEDLKKSIGLNQKFQMITELFEGDNDAYEALIQGIEQAPDAKAATNLINEKKQALSWDEENQALQILIDLTERRHL